MTASNGLVVLGAGNAPNFRQAPICEGCGSCCKSYPGATTPEQWPSGREMAHAIAAALATGQWVVDYEDDDINPSGKRKRTCWVRPAMKGGTDKPYFIDGPSMHTARRECVFLDPTGCRLPRANRPQGCNSLKPMFTVFGYRCMPPKSMSMDGLALRWRPYQRQMRRAIALCADTLEKKGL